MKSYSSYKPSPMPWLSIIPETWDVKIGMTFFEEKLVKNMGLIENQVLSLSYGQIKIKPKEKLHGLVPESFETYQIVDEGDIIIRATDLQNDKNSLRTGLVKNRGIITSAYLCLKSKSFEKAEYNHWLLHGLDLMKVFYGLGSGLRQNLSWNDFKRLPLPLPPSEDREAIVRYLNWKSDKVKRLIRQKKQLIELFVERRKSATYEAISAEGTTYHRLEVVTEKVQRSVSRLADEQYTPIGLYNRGRGIFHKPETKGCDLGDSTFYWVKSGDLVLSGQFAWEGAVALAGPADDGCIASHRYPILKCAQDILDAGFLYSYFTTKEGHLLLNYHSRGAAGRNRPLNARTLLKEKIPVPSHERQKEVDELVRQEIRLRYDVAREEMLLKEYLNRLISDVVTGKVDVRSVEIPDFEAVEADLEVQDDEESEDELITEGIEE